MTRNSRRDLHKASQSVITYILLSFLYEQEKFQSSVWISLYYIRMRDTFTFDGSLARALFVHQVLNSPCILTNYIRQVGGGFFLSSIDSPLDTRKIRRRRKKTALKGGNWADDNLHLGERERKRAGELFGCLLLSRSPGFTL